MKLRYKIAGGSLALLLVAVTALALVLSHTTACPAPLTATTAADTMRAIEYHCYGSPEVLQLTSAQKPTPGADEVLVRVRAASVNPLDWHYMRGSPYFMRLGSGLGAPTDPRLGVDFAGTVEAIGRNVTRFKPGDAVFGAAGGAFAEYVTVDASRAVAPKPDNISFEQAAAVPIAAVSALQALRDKGKLKPGHEVLINGASGGVGTFAVQIAKSMGAIVTGVCSTRNVEMVKSLGADHVIDYTRENYTEADRQYDLIIDNVGNHSLLANRQVLRPQGIMVLVGAPTGNWLGALKRPLQAMLLSPLVDQDFIMLMAQLRLDDLAALGELMQAGAVTPVIDRRFSLGQTREAISYSESGRARGKIIIEVQ